MKQITAVEWLINQIKEDQSIKAKSMGEWNTVFEQAKEMEKEQIIDAIDYAYFDEDGNQMTGEEYYNETYKSE